MSREEKNVLESRECIRRIGAENGLAKRNVGEERYPHDEALR